MGFMRRGNYEKNTIEIVVDHVRHTIRSEMEHMDFPYISTELSALRTRTITKSRADIICRCNIRKGCLRPYMKLTKITNKNQ